MAVAANQVVRRINRHAPERRRDLMLRRQAPGHQTGNARGRGSCDSGEDPGRQDDRVGIQCEQAGGIEMSVDGLQDGKLEANQQLPDAEKPLRETEIEQTIGAIEHPHRLDNENLLVGSAQRSGPSETDAPETETKSGGQDCEHRPAWNLQRRRSVRGRSRSDVLEPVSGSRLLSRGRRGSRPATSQLMAL